MGRNSASNGSRRSAFHSDKSTKHRERQLLEAPIEDRFVLGPAQSSTPKGISLFDQSGSAMRRKDRPADKHPNAEAIEGLSATQLREHYRASFGKDPGQMGKAGLREAFLRPNAPSLGNTRVVSVG